MITLDKMAKKKVINNQIYLNEKEFEEYVKIFNYYDVDKEDKLVNSFSQWALAIGKENLLKDMRKDLKEGKGIYFDGIEVIRK